MKYFPDSALVQLEFDKIKLLVQAHCGTEYARLKSENLRIHTAREFIELDLQQSHEFKLLLEQSQYFPNDFTQNIARDLKLLSIPGAQLNGEQFLQIRSLAENIKNIFHWFDNERRIAYPGLTKVIANTYYEKKIREWIDEILDEKGIVLDKASDALADIRHSLSKKRNELRRLFDRILSKLNKAGFVADIEEAFLNGRRVVAIFAEHKRQNWIRVARTTSPLSLRSLHFPNFIRRKITIRTITIITDRSPIAHLLSAPRLKNSKRSSKTN